ncbi:hypothetical protein C1645_822479 [Glomus cerebriforme]|uniref:Uncharacterized protein n=1 Tax=Glomus cerebriforme TaxID=658196 RepID=A0A397T460_9GLOM|nr:hypothetical protein C1645_822479 [Glomus cerebriforme]
MKFDILFIGLLTLTSATCEKSFNLPVCSECQKEIWKAWESPSSCGFQIHLLNDIAKKYHYTFGFAHPVFYDMTLYNKAIKEACAAEFSCTYEEDLKIWSGIENKCATELSTYIDWSANPNSFTSNDNEILRAYGSLLLFYFVIPEHNSVCHKTTNGELCGIESVKPLINWLETVAPEGNANITYDHQFVYKSDGTRLPIPKELFQCGECTTNMVQEYGTWIDQHAVPDPIVKNIFGSLEIIKMHFTCPVNI